MLDESEGVRSVVKYRRKIQKRINANRKIAATIILPFKRRLARLLISFG